MANFAAVKSENEQGLQHPGRSSDLDAQTSFPALDCAKDVAFYSGDKGGTGVVAVASWDNAATKHGMFDAALFERVLVIPRSRAMGFVLSTTSFSVEVWNAFQGAAKTLTSISISGGGGVTISGGLGDSAVFGPGRSSIYTATVAQDGPAAMTNVATWNFVGVSGADLSLTGSRITVFSVEIDWSEGFEESIEYRTAILKAFSTKEQRVQLRTKPRYGASFAAITTSKRETAAFDAVLDSWQARVFGVPWWMDASLLLANVSAGANSISVDTTNRPSFEVGGLVMIWTDQFNWEALQVATVASGSIGLATAIGRAWTAGARVVPLKRGRLGESFAMKRETSGVSTFKVSFSCEGV